MWKKSVELNEEILIFEHDAVLVDKIISNYNLVCTFGKQVMVILNKQCLLVHLNTQRYFGGARIWCKTQGAKLLIEQAKIDGH